MTREETKKNLPLITAFAEGKTIQYYNDEKKDWVDVDEHPSYSFAVKWRIKPEPEYCPFKNAKECIAAMNNHKPFGWVLWKRSKFMADGLLYLQICSVGDKVVGFCDVEEGEEYEGLFEKYEFLDGTPCGIKVE